MKHGRKGKVKEKSEEKEWMNKKRQKQVEIEKKKLRHK